MERDISDFLDKLKRKASETRFSLRVAEEGTVLSVGDGIVHVGGLHNAELYELVIFESGDRGVVFDIAPDSLGIVLFSSGDNLRAGNKVFRTEQIASVQAGDDVLGRVLDALGEPIDGGPRPDNTMPYPVERVAPALADRDFVNTPLYTGIKIIDAMLPIGRGQRELIIGDPSTGKTALALDAVINQKNSDVISVYAAIGQKKSQILKVIDEIKKYGDMAKTVFIASDASSSFGLQYIAPYSATAIAEYFLDRGRDVLIIYDDLTKHAEAYRSLSLLLKRPPGREAYPGDIFFIHSRLLERSAKLGKAGGGGSITSLPIIETQQGRISSYIPTNLISITDGQIYLDTALFNKGYLPAVDVGRSVSRIGGRAQTQAMKSVAESLKIDYSRFTEVEVFTKFGAQVEEETAKLIRRGQRLRESLKQHRFHPLSPDVEVVTFIILESGVLDHVPPEETEKTCNEVLEGIKTAFPEIVERIRLEGALAGSDMKKLTDFITSRWK